MEFKRDRDTLHATEDTIQAALSGDGEALGRLLASYMPQLYRVALRIVGTREEAEEALQMGWSRLCGIFASSRDALAFPPG
jgi:DNA-directed RNA polymerase specialized sigma24 family protein